MGPLSRMKVCLDLFLSLSRIPLRPLRARTSYVKSRIGLLPIPGPTPLLNVPCLFKGLFRLNALNCLLLGLLLGLLLLLPLLRLLFPGRGFAPVGAVRRGLAPIPKLKKAGLGIPGGRCRSRHHDSRPASFFHQPSSSSSSASSRYSSFRVSSPCYPVFSPGSSFQKDHSGGYFTYPSLLFPLFCSYEKGWPLSYHYRPVYPQQVPPCS